MATDAGAFTAVVYDPSPATRAAQLDATVRAHRALAEDRRYADRRRRHLLTEQARLTRELEAVNTELRELA